MRGGKIISVIIPALNEEKAIGKVISDIPEWVDRVIVIDNGSDDKTAEVAKQNGAEVLNEPVRGYGQACLTGIGELDEGCDIIVFIDGDYSDYADEMSLLVDPLIDETYDFVIGSRTKGGAQKGSLTTQQIFGNWLACTLMKILWGTQYTDLGPYRAITHKALKKLGMSDKGYGWTIEMQIKAVLKHISFKEVPVKYRVRIGTSKISGTFTGSLLAGLKIIRVIASFALMHGSTLFSRKKLHI